MRIASFLAVVLALLLCGCAIPFDIYTAESDMDIPATLGTYIEAVCNSPDQTQNSQITFSSLTLIYSITNTSPLSGTINLYLSLKTAADGDKSTATQILSVTVEGNSTAGGAVSPSILIDAIKQPQFVIGLENSNLDLLTYSATMTYRFHATGSFSP